MDVIKDAAKKDDKNQSPEHDDDVGSESSQSSSEGTSASSTFCNLEKDYARMLQEFKNNAALAPYEAEYTRLYESLYNAHKAEDSLQRQCMALKEEIIENASKVYELSARADSDAKEISRLREEIVNAMKLADAAHTREQNAQELLENLRLNITKLNQELEHKNKELAAHEDVALNKQKEGMMRERERLVGELETMRQRLKNMTAYTEELERRGNIADHQISEMQENIDMQLSEISREKRARENAEDSLEQVREDLSIKTSELDAANIALKTATTNSLKLQTTLKEERMAKEKMQKEISKLTVKRSNLQSDLDSANNQIDALEKDINDKEKLARNLKIDYNRSRDEIAKLKYDKDALDKKLAKADVEHAKMEQDFKQAKTEAKNAGYEMQTLRKTLNDEKQRIESLTREKNILARSKETSRDQIKRLHHELIVCDHSRKKIEHELDDALQVSIEIRKQMEAVEKERDKYNIEVQELAQRVDDYISEVKLKQVEIIDYKKQLSEAEAKYRQQQNLFEAVCAERNACSKSLLEAQEEIDDLKAKLKIMNQQIEQLKEGISTKEAELSKQEFLLSRLEKEKEGLKVELQLSRKEVYNLKREIEEMKKEAKRLRQTIKEADAEINRQKKDIDNVMNERDILGTQLVRRNDELSLQYGRIKVLNGTLQRGEAQYSQRLEDIRLLKLEVKKLRTEKALLTKNIENIADLRQEIFHLDRDLTKERLKVMALEEELQTPLNIHRWRKLEGTDPATFDLLKKIQLLQKRIIKMGVELIAKDRKVRDTEKLYMNLREILARHPGPQAVDALDRTQRALRDRGKKMKCLVSEVNMYEVQINEYKFNMERINKEMIDLKTKYFVQKRKLQKSKESAVKSLSEPVLPPVTPCPKKFCGGGFNMTAPTPRNCYTLDSTCR